MYIQKFKLDFLRNYCADLNQILYESFQIREWKSDDTMAGHMTKMATMPIYGKYPLKIFISGTSMPISMKLSM